MLLDLTQKQVAPDVTVVALKGRLTLGQESNSLEELLRGLAGNGPRKVVLDLKDLSYMDSAGMGAIAKSMVTLLQSQGTLRLAGTTERVMSAIRITRLDKILHMYPDLDSALDGL